MSVKVSSVEQVRRNRNARPKGMAFLRLEGDEMKKVNVDAVCL